jgi:hypothetical protein
VPGEAALNASCFLDHARIVIQMESPRQTIREVTESDIGSPRPMAAVDETRTLRPPFEDYDEFLGGRHTPLYAATTPSASATTVVGSSSSHNLLITPKHSRQSSWNVGHHLPCCFLPFGGVLWSRSIRHKVSGSGFFPPSR